MRSRKDVKFSHRHNETKFIILKVFAHPTRWHTSENIAEITGLEPNNVSMQLGKLFKQGYLWRRNIGKKSYRYRYLKPQGDRTLRRLWIRNQLILRTDDPRIDLNLDHPIPDEYLTLTFELEQQFNMWLHGR